jgi:hypothetical protein
VRSPEPQRSMAIAARHPITRHLPRSAREFQRTPKTTTLNHLPLPRIAPLPPPVPSREGTRVPPKSSYKVRILNNLVFQGARTAVCRFPFPTRKKHADSGTLTCHPSPTVSDNGTNSNFPAFATFCTIPRTAQQCPRGGCEVDIEKFPGVSTAWPCSA